MPFIRKAYIYLLMYVLGGSFIGLGRIMDIPIFALLLFIITLIVFLGCFFKTKYLASTVDGKLWFPFIAWTVLGAFMNAVPSFICMYSVAFIILYIAIGNKMKYVFPYKLFFVFGVILIFSQIVQMLLPGLYQLITSLLFGSRFNGFSSGLQGFTNQTGKAAAILTYALGAYLYFYSSKKKYYVNTIVILSFVIAVLLTGKRSMTFVVILVPMIVLLVSSKKKSSLLKITLSLTVLAVSVLSFIESNSDKLNEIAGFKKVSKGVKMFVDDEGDVELGEREILWRMALRGYEKNPIFGVGVAQFENWSGLPTNVHNAYLQVLCEQGNVGLLFFVVPLLYCLLHTIYLVRIADENDPGKKVLQFSLFVQLYFIIYGFSGNPTRNPNGYIIYFCAIGLLQSYQYHNYKEKREFL